MGEIANVKVDAEVDTKDTSRTPSSAERSVTLDASESYEGWRDHFAHQRLGVLYVVGLICNPVFAVLDFLIQPTSLQTLVLIRVIMELGLFLASSD